MTCGVPPSKLHFTGMLDFIYRAAIVIWLGTVLAFPSGPSEFFVLCIGGEGHVEIERAQPNGQCADDLGLGDDCLACVDLSYKTDVGIQRQNPDSDRTPRAAVLATVVWSSRREVDPLEFPPNGRIRSYASATSFLRSTILRI